MRTLHAALLLSLVLPAEAARLKVELMVSPGQVVLRRNCPDAFGANPAMPLGAVGAASVNPYQEQRYPGSVMVSVSGGVPPYRYDWHGLMADGSVCSVMPGTVRVTVSDATGRSVTRTAHVGAQQRVLPAPCGEVPLVTEPSVNLKHATGSNYFGSAKPVLRRKPQPVRTQPSSIERGTSSGSKPGQVRSTPGGGGVKREAPKVVPAERLQR
jgi:hypothetical protein